MKRKLFLAFLKSSGCEFLREGSNHSLFINVENKKASTVPRHSEINDNLIRKICKDLDIPNPFKR